MNKKPKYPLWKLLLVGKDPLDRKHAPKIIEYFWIALSNFINMILLMVIIYQVLSKNDISINRLQIIFENFWNKIVLSFLIGNSVATFCSLIRLMRILKKTEEFKVFAYLVIAFSLIPLMSPLAFGFSLIGYVNNEIEFV